VREGKGVGRTKRNEAAGRDESGGTVGRAETRRRQATGRELRELDATEVDEALDRAWKLRRVDWVLV
jgi:hypothetical protein